MLDISSPAILMLITRYMQFIYLLDYATPLIRYYLMRDARCLLAAGAMSSHIYMRHYQLDSYAPRCYYADADYATICRHGRYAEVMLLAAFAIFFTATGHYATFSRLSPACFTMFACFFSLLLFHRCLLMPLFFHMFSCSRYAYVISLRHAYMLSCRFAAAFAFAAFHAARCHTLCHTPAYYFTGAIFAVVFSPLLIAAMLIAGATC